MFLEQELLCAIEVVTIGVLNVPRVSVPKLRILLLPITCPCLTSVITTALPSIAITTISVGSTLIPTSAARSPEPSMVDILLGFIEGGPISFMGVYYYHSYNLSFRIMIRRTRHWCATSAVTLLTSVDVSEHSLLTCHFRPLPYTAPITQIGSIPLIISS